MKFLEIDKKEAISPPKKDITKKNQFKKKLQNTQNVKILKKKLIFRWWRR